MSNLKYKFHRLILEDLYFLKIDDSGVNFHTLGVNSPLNCRLKIKRMPICDFSLRHMKINSIEPDLKFPEIPISWCHFVFEI